MSKRIIQFGTSRFLQAHVDLFVHEARCARQEIGPITIVKTTAGVDRSGRIAAFKRGRPFPVRVRGLAGGTTIDDLTEVACVDQAFDAETEWPAVVQCFARDADIAVSNVGDRGYEVDSEKAASEIANGRLPASFPGKLLVLLKARFEAGAKPLLFLPTELLTGNGLKLAAAVSDLAARTRQSADFQAWLNDSVVFAETLVDRIVSAPIEPIGAVAEPYALFAIARGRFSEPFQHPSLHMVDDLEPFERLKLHILNLGHTVLAAGWLRRGAVAGVTVRDAVSGGSVAEALCVVYSEEVIPGFSRRGLAKEAEAYIGTTLERFKNPFLEHLLSDIAQNHPAKVKSRISAFIDWVQERDPSFSAPRLMALVAAS